MTLAFQYRQTVIAAHPPRSRSQQKRVSPAPMTLSDHVNGIADGMPLQFARGETIFNQDEPAEYVYRLAEGTVRLCRYMPDGRRYVLDFFLPGDIIGFAE